MLTELLEEVQNTISASAAHDPRQIIKNNRTLKKKIEELKTLLEETLTGLNSKSDTNLKSLKAKSLKLKKQKNSLVRDIKAANDATANFSSKGEEKLEDIESKLVRLPLDCCRAHIGLASNIVSCVACIEHSS